MGDNHLMLVYYEARKKFLEIIKEACGNQISLTKLTVGGYTILYIEEDGRVLYIVDQGVTGMRIRVWVHGTFPKLPASMIGNYSWWDGKRSIEELYV